MNIRIRFFEDEFTDAIGAGIYGIYIQKDKKEDLLYVRESVCILVRCATHLYEIKKGNGYLGFTKETIQNNDITIVFKLIEQITCSVERKNKEKEIIKQKHPRMQSGISERLKTVNEMIDEMINFLNS